MSRKKKTRRLKDRLSVKTGSKKNFLKDGQKGQIPSKNRLAKHSRQKSAYEKHLAGESGKEKAEEVTEIVEEPEEGDDKEE
ncbi:MAG: hypothetical protein LAT62_01885 [Natronospirillum sp.]|uniref:hypothetical protein n=1 Tax=Natronospirillum sp. TaxID=2812955 RepID=UPI0025F4D426|nr:hypothetical protein [Natronospirillum sp.]MCH8550655.1 hypothetical protein [Natronospirillum sp.]